MNYLEYYDAPIDQTIKTRVSCRTYEDRLLDEKAKRGLAEFGAQFRTGLSGERIAFQILEFGPDDLKGKRTAVYGLIKHPRTFIAAAIDGAEGYPVSFGYAMEHVVLKATEIGLGTCWLGYFNPGIVQGIELAAGQVIPALCVVGYPAEKRSFKESMARFVVGAKRRKAWNELFFDGDPDVSLTPDAAGPYAEALELLRWAPSAGNTQPWRIIRDRDRTAFHFYKKPVNRRYEDIKLHDIDLGIALCHFELGARKNGLSGNWERRADTLKKAPPDYKYIASWIPS